MESPNKGKKTTSDNNDRKAPSIQIHIPTSSRSNSAANPLTPVSGARRRIGLAVDLSNESAFAVRWSVQNYLRPGDAVILIHVAPTSVLYGADWGPIPQTQHSPRTPETQKQLEDDFDAFTASKADELAKPLKETGFPFKIHIVKDHDMRERLCLELERLGLSAVVMGSRGYGAEKSGNYGKLGSVTDYCVRHCFCPVVVVVRYPDEKDCGNGQPVATVKQDEMDQKDV